MHPIIAMINVSAVNQYIGIHTLNDEKGFQELKIWIKYMNYKLFLEHTHSNEYYRSEHLYVE